MSNDAREREWLESLHVGSEVALWHWGSFRGRYEFAVIEGETPKRWRVYGRDFNKDDGCERGPRARCRLIEPSDELKQELRDEEEKNQLLTRLRSGTSWSSLSLDVLRKIAAVLDTHTGKELREG